MKRRDFVIGLGGAAVALPLATRAQQPTMPTIGFLHGQSAGQFTHFVAAFKRGLADEGYVEGRDLAIEYRWAEDQEERLPSLAADLVKHRASVIAASGGLPVSFAAKSATATIPIVFVTGGDPVREGLVASLNRPADNLTGVYSLITEIEAKRLGLLHELVPRAESLATLLNPASPNAENQTTEIENAARVLGQRIHILRAFDDRDIDEAFASLARLRVGAMSITGHPSFGRRRDLIIALAARHAIPVIYAQRDFVEAGGLFCYGPNIAEAYRQAGIYTGRILKGAKPEELPILQSTKFELVINLKTAKALGITVPPTLLARADEVIE